MRLLRCLAGGILCRFKSNADKIVVCSAPLGLKEIDGKNYKVPLDSKGGMCPYFSPVEMSDSPLEEVIIE